jgi:chromosome segregation ATPase
MSSAESAPRRRSRSEIEDDEEADIVRSSQRTPPSTSTAKRARTNGYGNGSQSESPTSESSYTAQSQRHRSNLYDDEDEDSNEGGHNPWQPGAIVRVKLSNFVTYENAEFFPGPNLNMVIGPNGTGKSSLVCAICLGLGWGPKHLGRGGEVGEFVKHNMSDAQIEIELQRRPNEPRNHVVKLRIIRDGNNREWWLDGKRTSLKAVQELTKSLSIQVDNLCQFLPQDKVSEFAALSPVELLQQTQRAAAPEQMLDWHEKLKRYRKDQKGLELQYGADKETLEGWENRQQNLRAEVQRLQERQQIQEKVNVLKKTIPFVEYRDAVNRHREFRDKKKAAQERLKKLEKRLAPTLASVTQKKAYRDQIIGVAKERKNALHAAESDADKIVKEFEILDEKVQDKDAEFQAERTADVKRKQEVDKIERSIRGMRARLNDAQIEFDAADWNERVVSA